jgi:four helix bundle protein
MGFKRIEDCRTYAIAREFKLEVYAIAHEQPRAMADHKYIGQLFDAASGGESNFREGFDRFMAAETSQFIRYGLSSLGEAQTRLQDGIHRGYFARPRCERAFELADHATRSARAWRTSLEPFIRARSRKSRDPDET